MMIRQTFTCAAALVALAGMAQAQISPAIQTGTRPALAGPTVKVARVNPEVVKITGLVTSACSTGPLLFEKGKTPPMAFRAANLRSASLGVVRPTAGATSATPYAEMLGGPNGALSGLRLIGPMMESISRAELIIGNEAPRPVNIFARTTPNQMCERTVSSIGVTLPLPDVSTPIRARLRLYGFGRNIGGLATGQLLCFVNTGELGLNTAIPCANPPGPAPLAQEIDLAIYPHPRFEQKLLPTRGFVGSEARVGGLLKVAGRNLGNITFPVPGSREFAAARVISQTPTEWTGEVFYDFRPGSTSASVLLQPGVTLMRGNTLAVIGGWDTSRTADVQRTSTATVSFVRR